MIKTITSVLFILLILVNTSFAAQASQQWADINAQIVATNETVQATIATVNADISNRRQALQQQLQAIKVKSLQTKNSAKQLTASLQKLQQQEAELKQLLVGKQKTLEKIETTVRDNAKLILINNSDNNVVSVASMSIKQLQQISTSDDFPALTDIHILNQIILDNIAQSGQLTLSREMVFNRDGVAVEAQVLRCGDFQVIYKHGDEVGFLIRDAVTSSLRVATYVPNTTEFENINSIFRLATSASNKLIIVKHFPVAISGGDFINNPPPVNGLWSAVTSGGLFIWPIILLAIVGILLVLERCLVLYRIVANGSQAVTRATELLPGKLLTPAECVVGAIARVAHESLEVRECRMEEAILEQLPRLERFLQTLKIMAAIAPLLGLLGTVSGIIQTFQVISTSGNSDPKLLSAGISEALLTTEAGLLVAIPLLLCHHFLQLRVKTIVLDMESAGAAMLSPVTPKDLV